LQVNNSPSGAHVNYQLSAPAHLLPAIATRLALNAPALAYSLCTPNIPQPSKHSVQLILQPSFFHTVPVKTQPACVEVFLIPSPLAALQGYMLAAAGNHTDLAQAAPILDALAPMPTGWLHVGDFGAAGFLHQLWIILTGNHADGPLPFWQNMRPPQDGFRLNHPDLIAQLSSLMAQQQLLIQSLSGVAHTFLAQYPCSEFSPYNPQQAQLLNQENMDKLSPAHQIAQLLSSFQTNK
jgi:hypothetical protein